MKKRELVGKVKWLEKQEKSLKDTLAEYKKILERKDSEYIITYQSGLVESVNACRLEGFYDNVLLYDKNGLMIGCIINPISVIKKDVLCID